MFFKRLPLFLLLHLIKEESLLHSEKVRFLHFKLKFYWI